MDEIIYTTPKKNALVIQHNRLIEAKYNLTLQEIRIVLWLLWEIQPGDKDFKRYRVQISDLAEYIGLASDGGAFYWKIEEVTKRLLTKPIVIEDLARKRTIQANWIASADYEWGKGYVDVSLAPVLLPYLLELKDGCYTKFALKWAISMKSVYAIRIYELLKQYEKLKERKVTVMDLREYCGIEAWEYKLFADFRVNVIEIAKREINAKTDIMFEYEQIKEGRKVCAINFIIKRNPKAGQAEEMREDPKLSFLVSRLTSHGMGEAKAREYVTSYPPEAIEWAAKELESRLRAKTGAEKITNPAGWLCSAIEEGYGSQRTIFQAEQDKKKQEQKREEDEQARKQARDMETTRAYRKYATEYITSFIDWMREKERQILETTFAAELTEQGDHFAVKFADKHDWLDMIIRNKVVAFLQEYRSDFKILPKDAFAMAEQS